MTQKLRRCPFCKGKAIKCSGYDQGKVKCYDIDCPISGVPMFPDKWNGPTTDNSEALAALEKFEKWCSSPPGKSASITDEELGELVDAMLAMRKFLPHYRAALSGGGDVIPARRARRTTRDSDPVLDDDFTGFVCRTIRALQRKISSALLLPRRLHIPSFNETAHLPLDIGRMEVHTLGDLYTAKSFITPRAIHQVTNSYQHGKKSGWQSCTFRCGNCTARRGGEAFECPALRNCAFILGRCNGVLLGFKCLVCGIALLTPDTAHGFLFRRGFADGGNRLDRLIGTLIESHRRERQTLIRRIHEIKHLLRQRDGAFAPLTMIERELKIMFSQIFRFHFVAVHV